MSKKRVNKTKSKRKSDDVLSRENRPLFRAACAIVARKYSDLLRFWRDCRYKPCRCARRCVGDPRACLEKRLPGLSYEVRLAAQSQMPSEVPANADYFVRVAYRYGPDALCVHLPQRRASGKKPSAEPRRC